MSRALIGITKTENESKIGFILTAICVYLSNGKPIALTTKNPHYDLTLQGLILGGGRDIHPKYYNYSELKKNYPYDTARDELEFTWFQKAQDLEIPILGICRGAQLINIARGGTLHFDLRKAYEKAAYPSGLLAKIFFRKKIKIVDDSLLYRIINQQQIKVNSSHTQSIDKLGENLIITSAEANAVVQSIEDPSAKFLLGVQFHPEFILFSGIFRNIFKQFVISGTKL